MSTDNTVFLFSDGTSAADVGRYDPMGFKMHFESDNIRFIGKHRTIIRSCTAENKLIELQLKLNFHKNLAPRFVTDIQTQFYVETESE